MRSHQSRRRRRGADTHLEVIFADRPLFNDLEIAAPQGLGKCRTPGTGIAQAPALQEPAPAGDRRTVQHAVSNDRAGEISVGIQSVELCLQQLS